MKKFLFQCDDAFTLHGRGLILVGNLTAGEIHSNQLVEIPTNRGMRLGRIKKLEMNRELIDHVATNDNIGILVDKFNDKYLNRILKNLPSTEEEFRLHGSAIETIGLEFPCNLEGPVPNEEFVMFDSET